MGILKKDTIVESTGNVDSLKNPELDGSSTSKNAKNRQKREKRKAKRRMLKDEEDAGEVPIEKSNEGNRKSRVKKTAEEKSVAFIATHGRPWIPRKEWFQQKIDAEEMGGSVEAEKESDQDVKKTKQKVKKRRGKKRKLAEADMVPSKKSNDDSKIPGVTITAEEKVKKTKRKVKKGKTKKRDAVNTSPVQ